MGPGCPPAQTSSKMVSTELMSNIGSRHYLRKVVFNTGGLKILVHFPSVLQCHAHIGCMTPPKIKLFINLRISVIAFDKEFSLLKVGKGLEGKIWRPRLSEGSRTSKSSGHLGSAWVTSVVWTTRGSHLAWGW